MKMINKLILFNLLAVLTNTALAHNGHGNNGFVHSASGIEQLLLAFLLAMFIYQSVRLVKRHSIAPRLGAFIKRLRNK